MIHASKRSYIPVVLVLLVAVALILTPAAGHAQEARETRPDIRILTDAEFDADHGVRSGTGTPEDPFVISGWDVHSIFIKDTNSSVVLTDNNVHGTMVLDWIGRDVTVTDSTITDLRVNQNVRRTGLPTSGLIADNVFLRVGQLRHWDGVFTRNLVGQPFGGSAVDEVYDETFGSVRAVNFDGFNGAHFTHNTIYGYVDARIHGHHHSSAFGEDSHQHATGATGEMEMRMDHTQRYHEVFIHNNTITVPAGSYTALNYLDTNHAGNDRTATSEQNEDLNLPHVHYTRVHITDNLLNGAGISVNVFNANDERHTATTRGLLRIDRNTITLSQPKYLPWSPPQGITVSQAKDVDLFIRQNTIAGAHQHDPLAPYITMNAVSGIDLRTIDLALTRIYDNHISNVEWGVRAASMTDQVRWLLGGNVMDNVAQAVYSSSSVANPPEDRPAEEEDDVAEPTPEPPHDEHEGH